METQRGDPRFARLQRQMLRETGFSNIKATATCFYRGTPEAIKEYRKFVFAMGSAPNFRNQAMAMNLCD